MRLSVTARGDASGSLHGASHVRTKMPDFLRTYLTTGCQEPSSSLHVASHVKVDHSYHTLIIFVVTKGQVKSFWLGAPSHPGWPAEQRGRSRGGTPARSGCSTCSRRSASSAGGLAAHTTGRAPSATRTTSSSPSTGRASRPSGRCTCTMR